MRKTAVVASLSAAALGAILLAGSANASSVDTASHIGIIKRPTTSYQYPTNQSQPVHYCLRAEQKVNVLCFTEGQEINGNFYWYRIGQDGKLGFVHRDAVAGVNGVPHC